MAQFSLPALFFHYFSTKFFLFNGEVAQESFALIYRYPSVPHVSNLFFCCIVFPLIEKALHFCHTGIDETVSIGKTSGQKTSTTFFDQRRYAPGKAD